jgi:hypothetical protein
MGKDEDEFQEYQRQQKDITRNLPNDWEKQLQDDKTQKDFDTHQKTEDRRNEFRKDRDAAREKRVKEEAQAAEKKRKELEERAEKVRRAEQTANTIKRNQYDSEKAEEFKRDAARGAARVKVTQDEQSALLNAKSAPERIAIRQRIDARNRAENARIQAANNPTPETDHWIKGAGGIYHNVRMGEPKTVQGNIKNAIKKSVSNVPSVSDKMITNLFGNTVEKMTRPTTPQVAKQQTTFYKGEMKQMSKVVNRRQITGGNVKQIMVVHKGDVMANPDFVSAILGNTPLETQTAKNKKAGKPGALSKLDRFVSSL